MGKLKQLWETLRGVKQQEESATEVKPVGMFSTDIQYERQSYHDVLNTALARTFQRTSSNFKVVDDKGFAMDAKEAPGFAQDGMPVLFPYGVNMPSAQLGWYGSQSFIGYQMAALLSQQWLISKCCIMPARDAVRNGYELTVNDGTEIDTEVLDAIRRADVKFRLNSNLIEFINKGRVFGIRIAMFKIDSEDPDYYKKPFNPDGVMPGSYKGISQIDPYWITPELDGEAASDPSSMFFYEPTWWRVNGHRIHRTHLIIYRTEELPDILKPTYIYGGVPIPQKIYERVYAAERTANEAPQLALTKRTDVLKVDLTQALANEVNFDASIQKWVYNRDNYGVKTIGLDEEMQQFDTSLADLDAVIMSQYQIVAAAANVPAVKLLGTSPKGFNATGDYEEKSYHEELKSIQSHDLTPLIERHHLLLIRSEIAPRFNMSPFSTSVSWNPLNEVGAKEQAEINKLKADTGLVLMNSGAIDGEDERQRIVNDPSSGYNGISADVPNEEEPEEQSSLEYA